MHHHRQATCDPYMMLRVEGLHAHWDYIVGSRGFENYCHTLHVKRPRRLGFTSVCRGFSVPLQVTIETIPAITCGQTVQQKEQKSPSQEVWEASSAYFFPLQEWVPETQPRSSRRKTGAYHLGCVTRSWKPTTTRQSDLRAAFICDNQHEKGVPSGFYVEYLYDMASFMGTWEALCDFGAFRGKPPEEVW